MCCGHLLGDSGPAPGTSLLDRIDHDFCVCCGMVRGTHRNIVKNYIAERVWVCSVSAPYDTPNGQESCCKSTRDGIDHAVMYRDIILSRLGDEMREKMLQP